MKIKDRVLVHQKLCLTTRVKKLFVNEIIQTITFKVDISTTDQKTGNDWGNDFGQGWSSSQGTAPALTETMAGAGVYTMFYIVSRIHS